MIKTTPMPVNAGVTAPRRRATAGSIWRRLTEPSASLREPDRRRQAQLLASLLVFILPIGILTAGVTTALAEPSDHYTGYWLTLLALGPLSVAYVLSRTRYFTLGALISVVVSSLAVFAGALFGGSPVDLGFFDYLVVPLLFGKLFLSTRQLLWLTIADAVGLLAVPRILPLITYQDVLLGPMTFVAVSASLFILSSRHRNQLEHDRQVELAEKEQRYRTLVEQIPAITYLDAVDPSSPTGFASLYVSPQFETLLGYDPREYHANPQGWFEMIHRDDRERVRAEDTHHYATGESSTQEYRLISRSGRELWFRDQCAIRRDEISGRWLNQGILLDITDRMQAEMALRESEERFANIIGMAGEAIITADHEYRIVLFNQEAERIFGYTAAEVMQQSLELLIPGDRVELHRRHASAFAESPRAAPLTRLRRNLAGRRKDGSEFPAEGSISKSMAHGKVVFTVILRDISERRRMEEEIQRLNQDLERRVAERTAQLEAANQELEKEIAERKQAEEHLVLLERAVESSANGIVISDAAQPDNPVIFVNRAYEQITGYNKEEALGRNGRYLQGEDLDQAGIQRLRAAISEGRECHVVMRNYRKDGSLFWNELHVSPVRDSSGSVTHYVGVQNDITELKLTEEAVRASEERFRQLADNVREVFWVVRPDWSEFLYVNPAYEEMWGRTCESLYREPLSFLDGIHPADSEKMADWMQQQRVDKPAFAEHRIMRSDGSIGWIWSRAFPVRDSSGEVYRVVGLSEDVTERKRAEEELRKALAKEKDLNELKSRFISMTSHEFRTPLSTILSSTELLQHYNHKLSDDKKRDHLSRILSAVRNLTQMLDDVLILGKAEAGKLEVNPEPLDLVRFCRDLVDEMQLIAGDKFAIEFAADAEPPDAHLDPKLLRQILSNLLSNAIKYSPHGGRIHFDLRRDDGQVTFSIQDQGIGIPSEEQERMFETFHRARNVGNISGTGLGLTIVKRSVDLCGGNIRFDSAVGAGTTFNVSLPLGQPIHEVHA